MNDRLQPGEQAPELALVVIGERTTGSLRSTFVLDADGIIQSAQYQLDPHDHVHGLLTQVGGA